MPRLFGVWVEILLPAFFRENLSATYSALSALRWTEFHQNRKNPMREIQRFPNLGHNLGQNDKQNLHDYILKNYDIITDGSLQVREKL